MIIGRYALLIVLSQVVAVAGASAIDLDGKWRVEYGPSSAEFIDVVQSGTAVSTIVFQSQGGLPLSGTFDEPSLSLNLVATGCTPPLCIGLSARVLSNGNWFDGRLVFPPDPGTTRTLASRCECFDGNTADGDGCDAHCRVEPCYSCAGMPSTCTPSPDGAACDDRMDCTSGETCAGGVCGSSSSVPACRDLNGLWDLHSDGGGFVFDSIIRIQQRDEVVLFRDATNGVAGSLGVIDSATGVFNIQRPPSNILCSGFDTGTGVEAADLQSFAGSITASTATPHGCFPITFTIDGTRRTCGDGELDAGEQCDDGNFTSGDGCDVNCRPTGCGNGALSPGEQCDDGNTADGDGCSATCVSEACGDGVVTPNEQCDDGNLLSGDGCSVTCTIETCWACNGQPSACAPKVLTTCATPRDPHRASLKLRQSADDAKDAIGLRSGDTQTVAAAALGDPLTATDYQICLFDRSTPVPSILFATRVPGGGTCGSRPCWRSARGGFSYKDRAGSAGGITKLQIVGDVGGDGRVMVIGEGTGLSGPNGFPALPLPLPLAMQVQNVDGAGCFAVDIPAAGVSRNDPAKGRFTGRGAP